MKRHEWVDVLKQTNLNEMYYDRVSQYIVNLEEAMKSNDTRLQGAGNGMSYHRPSETELSDASRNLIALNIKILCRLSNLDRVKFMQAPIELHGDKPIQVESLKSSINISRDELNDSLSITYRDILDNKCIDIISDSINDEIEIGSDIYIYRALESVSIIEEILIGPKMLMSSRISFVKPIKTFSIKDL